MDRRYPERIDSKFRYVLLAAERAEALMRGARPKLEAEGLKAGRVAMEEIRTDAVEWDYGPAPEEAAAEEAVEVE